MSVDLEEMKNYLRVDHNDDDSLITYLIGSAESLCMNVLRVDSMEKITSTKDLKIAVMYAVAYLFEHREDADHHALILTLRALLFGSRQEGF